VNKLFLLFFLIFSLQYSLFSQSGSITNIQVSQRTDGSGNVDIYYDLQGSTSSFNMSVDVSFTNGAMYTTISPAYLTGNVGPTSPGNNLHIVWNGKGSHDKTFTTQTKIRLNATTFTCGQVLTDLRDGKTYNTVQISAQCWMAQNLNVGTKIPATSHQSNNQILEKYCYDNSEVNCSVYGGLYQWAEVVQYLNGATNTSSWNPVPSNPVQGICPDGWHIPSDAEWLMLVNFLNGASIAGGKMKEAGFSHWSSPNSGANNSSGLTILPGGGVNVPSGSYGNLTFSARLWSATEASGTTSMYRLLSYFATYANGNTSVKTSGSSIRCLKN
jgi:uncharacterized protein (TIGR02145 family)